MTKPAVRIYFFGLISLLEMHLTFWVKNAYRDDTWKEEVSSGRLKKAEDFQKIRRSRNQETSLVDCLQFCDKRELLLAGRELCENLGLENVEESRVFFKQAEDLRNLLAHSQQDLVGGSSWEELFELIKRIESFIHLSDELVEREANKSSNNFVDELWASA